MADRRLPRFSGTLVAQGGLSERPMEAVLKTARRVPTPVSWVRIPRPPHQGKQGLNRDDAAPAGKAGAAGVSGCVRRVAAVGGCLCAMCVPLRAGEVYGGVGGGVE